MDLDINLNYMMIVRVQALIKKIAIFLDREIKEVAEEIRTINLPAIFSTINDVFVKECEDFDEADNQGPLSRQISKIFTEVLKLETPPEEIQILDLFDKAEAFVTKIENKLDTDFLDMPGMTPANSQTKLSSIETETKPKKKKQKKS